jgi:hypothetical protein
MNYQAFTNDTLVMMHHGARGALAVDDELSKLGEEPRFKVRSTSDWKTHAADLETEMVRRGMTFEVIDWSAPAPDDPLQPEVPQGGDKTANRDTRFGDRIAAVINMR